MSLTKTELEQFLQKINPQLKVNSIKAYSVAIRNVAKNTKLDVSQDEFLKNKNIILKFLKEMEDFKKRKLLISSILLFLKDKLSKGDEETLKNIMVADIKLTDEELKKQEMTDKQRENWMPWSDVLKVREALAEQVSGLWKKKSLNPLQYNRLVDYIIVCLYTYQPPRRLDYKDMRPFGFPAKAITENDNYIDVKKKKFVFQNYKTKSTYDTQEVDIDSTLFNILKDFSKVAIPEQMKPENIEDQWLLLDTKGNQFNSSKLSQRISSIFNRPGFSANQLRHIYISEVVLPDKQKLLDMEEAAREMGHSVNTQALYKKFE